MAQKISIAHSNLSTKLGARGWIESTRLLELSQVVPMGLRKLLLLNTVKR